MKKIVVTGPESTGKSTLAELLSEHYDIPHVPEYAREYLTQLKEPYQEKDLLQIAKGQIKLENEAAAEGNELLICDTGLEVIKVWSQVKYGRCNPWILEQLAQRKADLYLLMAPDLPWDPDPLREHPEQREALYQIYLKELQNEHFVEIKGYKQKRLATAISAINHLK